MQRLDEPLDMSLKSRKRSPMHEYLPKKKRASAIAGARSTTDEEVVRHLVAPMVDVKIELDPSFKRYTPPSSPVTSGNGQNSHILNDLLNGGGYDRPVPVTGLAGPSSPQQSYAHGSERVIINNDAEGGLEEHFRRSLCRELYDDKESEGVDAHFSRSLGSAKWEEIQRANQQLSTTLDLSIPSARKKVKTEGDLAESSLHVKP